MKTVLKTALAVATVAAGVAGIASIPSVVSAWSGTRPSYTIEEINKGALGPTELSHGKDYKNDPSYPGTIVFNTISDSVIGDEKDFVGARECVLRDDGRCEGNSQTNLWDSRDIEVEDGKTYIVRLYAHNNNPNGEDAVAKDTHVYFNIPAISNSSIEVNGYINSSNATPQIVEDDVIFKSKDGVPFHLDYVKGSALLVNNSIGVNGYTLDDSIVNAKNHGVKIGYDKLDGNVPGCYQYDNFISIQVKAVYDYEYTVDKKVRLVGSDDKTWKDTVDAKVGDKVEFLIEYRNTGAVTQREVRLKDTLPGHLRYVAGSTKIMNSNYPNGAKINEDYIVTDGIKIGTYAPNANAFIKFTAEVINEETLACGHNTLVNWVHVGVGSTVRQDHAEVYTTRVCENEPDEPTPETPEVPKTEEEMPKAGPEAIVGGIVATGSIVTAAGYYIASRRQLR